MEREKNYTDQDEEKVTLDRLVRLEPSWATNRIRGAYNTMECIEQLLDSGDPSFVAKIKSLIGMYIPDFERSR